MRPEMRPAAFPNAAFQRADQPQAGYGTVPPRGRGSPRVEGSTAWPSVLGWKFRFIGAAVVMFLAYACIAGFFERAGGRAPRVVEQRDPDATLNCDVQGMSLEARARCMVARDAARDAEQKKRQEKRSAEEDKRRKEQKALDDEIIRQRDLLNRAEYDKRIDALALGQKRFVSDAEKQEFLEETTGVLVRLLVATQGHPAHALRWKVVNRSPRDAVDIINYEGKTMPDMALRAEAQKICDARTIPDWRIRCGEVLKREVLKLSVVTARFYLSVLVNSAPFSTSR